MWGDIAIAFLLAFITSFMLTPYSIILARKVGAVDVPKDNRRMHTKAMPKLGGIAVICGFIISFIYLIITMTIENEGNLDLFSDGEYLRKILGYFLGLTVLSITCFIDDIKTIKPIMKLTGQVLAAIIVTLFGLRLGDFDLFFINSTQISETLSIILTIGWIVGITNAINLMDGLDGLSSGITLISCLSLLIIFTLNNSPTIAIIMITALAGALVGFLPYNFNPAKTFIGDTGSNFLGYTISIVSILGIAKTYTVAVVILPIIVLALPIFDTLWAIFRRLVKEKSFKAIFKADKGHLHHRIVRRGFSTKQAVFILYGASACLGMFAVILFDSGIWKALSFAAMVAIIIAFGLKNFIKPVNEKGSQFECMNCKYIYNPKVGNTVAGINPHTEFDDLPEDWTCPVCGKDKSHFKLKEIK